MYVLYMISTARAVKRKNECCMVDFNKLSQKLAKETATMATNRNSNNNRNSNRNDKPRDDRRGRQEERTENKMLICYHINERNGRSFWTRIGVAFQNRDGSFNVKLECVPVNGELHIREYVPSEDRGDNDDSEGE
jgi:hypothetical protein